MSKIDLHIVSFDIPCPADYGGVIDVLGKIIALSENGVRISLHCFQYGRKPSRELENYCEEVHYYERKSIFWSLFSLQPTIVNTRASNKLLLRLLKINAPILFEGLHTCAFLGNKQLANRLKLVRMHNVEHEYYKGLSKGRNPIWKKIYLKWEAYRLMRFESILTHANFILAISSKEQSYLKQYGQEVHYLPAFHLNKQQESVEIKNFALYHGNLQVEENKKAVEFLLDVFEKLSLQLVVAGRNPGKSLKRQIANLPNVKLVINPTTDELKQLLKVAKVNCLPTFQATGIKLKLIQSLIEGNEVFVNDAMIDGTGLENYCRRLNSVEEWKVELSKIFTEEVDLNSILKRRKEVFLLFNNHKSAKQLEEWFAQVQ